MIIAQNLNKKFRVMERKGLFKKKVIKEIIAVKNVSLQVESGKIIGLLGVNGAGKTTVIKMLSGIIEPTSGSVTIDNIDALNNHLKVKEKINLITGGERNIYWRLTGRENLEYFGSLYYIPKEVLKSRIDYILDMVKLTDVQNIPVERYSKGMKQRLQIARGLINNPKYIFLDEPTLGLDISIASELRNYIKYLAKKEKKGILLTTHYITEAEELCDYIYIIDRGNIIFNGTVNEIKSNLDTSSELIIKVNRLTDSIKNFIINLTDDGDKVDFESESNSIRITSTKTYTGEVVSLLSSNNILILEIKRTEPSLEKVLLKFINRRDEYEKSFSNN